MNTGFRRRGVNDVSVQAVKRPTIIEARNAVCDFLQTALDEVHHVLVTKLVQIDPDEGTWEAEVEVFVPNPTVRALGLRVLKPVLDQETYLLRLDGQLNVLAYAPKESVDEK
jgi:hypothetical protein